MTMISLSELRTNPKSEIAMCLKRLYMHNDSDTFYKLSISHNQY